MAAILATLPLASQALPNPQKSVPQSSPASSALKQKWTKFEGTAGANLLTQLKQMYWAGVKREMVHILLTLAKWRQPVYAAIVLSDETDGLIHGFDTFMDQVSESARDFAARYEQKRTNYKYWEGMTHVKALEERSKDIQADRRAVALRIAVRETLAGRTKHDVIRGRARMLLQSSGFLDIDKLIEYRPPEHIASYWMKPVAPQLTLFRIDECHIPVFRSLACSDCQDTIHGSMFKSRQSSELIICESCYRRKHYRSDGFIKVYKHCILRRSITKKLGQMICRCSTVRHITPKGDYRELFPVDSTDFHRGLKVNGTMKCGLLELGTLVAEAKYEGMLSKHEVKVDLSDQKRMNESGEERRKLEVLKTERLRGPALKVYNQPSLVDSGTRSAETGHSTTLGENRVDEEIPSFLRKYVDKFPLGNVHMALRIGPLIIENGAKRSEKGVLITSRDPPNLQVLSDLDKDIEYSLSLSGETERTLKHQMRERESKRYKTVMKQVAGGAFSGLFEESLEDEIVDALLEESSRDFKKSVADEERVLGESINRLVTLLKRLVGERINFYLASVASRLLDLKTKLRWDLKSNNCQMFCDSLLDHELFGGLVAPSSAKNGDIPDPLYLMSFISRPGGYDKDPVKTKFDVPSGLIEEYLLKFRYSRHDESDIVDSLQEYWHDWGAFGNHLYSYQDLFPWDCTEAFGRYPAKCNKCNISKHVWAFPFDSWSIVALHLTRERYFYPPVDPEDPRPLSDIEWMKNRCTVLLAQDILLTAAAAMVKTRAFRKATRWLHNQDDPKKDRLKLGGIHRAQPFSHAFEHGRYHHYFVAEWAHLKREDQIAAYELLRDGRVKMPDVPGAPAHFHDGGSDGACGGCGSGTACGGIGAACGGGCGSCSAQACSSCGSGCSGCGGCGGCGG